MCGKRATAAGLLAPGETTPFADLASATGAFEAAEKALKDAESADVAARAALREQLVRNDGLLVALLASKGRAARYFRPGKRAKKDAAAAAPAATPPAPHAGTAGAGTI